MINDFTFYTSQRTKLKRLKVMNIPVRLERKSTKYRNPFEYFILAKTLSLFH